MRGATPPLLTSPDGVFGIETTFTFPPSTPGVLKTFLCHRTLKDW